MLAGFAADPRDVAASAAWFQATLLPEGPAGPKVLPRWTVDAALPPSPADGQRQGRSTLSGVLGPPYGDMEHSRAGVWPSEGSAMTAIAWRAPVPRRRLAALLTFLTVTFAITWGWDGALALLGMQVRQAVGWPTQAPGALGPLMGALAASLVLGPGMLRVWVRGLIVLRGPGWLWVGALGAPVVVFAVGAVFDPIQWRDLGRFSGLPGWPWPQTLLALLLISGVAEEAGWRGWLLPWLLPRFSPLAAASLVSVVWALWHLPMFFLIKSYRDAGAGFVPVFLASLWCGSVVLTWLWMRSGGSTLIVVLWHGLYDMLGGSAASAGVAGLAVNVLVDLVGVGLAVAELRLRRRGRTLFPPISRTGNVVPLASSTRVQGSW
jgi:membrane protease YdiL (CAAX protease family)